MNIKNYKILFGALMVLVFTTFTSCDEVEDADIGGTSVEEMSGDWWIVALEPDGITPAFGGDYEQFTTYNTSANDGQMWIDDHGNWFEIKSKVTANVNSLTFSGEEDEENLADGGTITITNGKINTKAYTTASNTVVDDIYFEAEVSWFPGTTFLFKGHKRTGFAEDENPHYSN